MRRVFSIILLGFSIIAITSTAHTQEAYDLSTILMGSTFKLKVADSLGTAFLIGRPVTQEAKMQYFVLVTADHLLRNANADNAFLIMRRKDADKYDRIEHSFKIRNQGKELWVKHPEVDVAVMYLPVPKDAYISLLPMNFLATEENLLQYELRPGDQVFALGYPLGRESNEAGFPILRTGTIASYPLVPTKTTKQFLLDFEVHPGNSGGPVFLISENRYYKGSFHIGMLRMILGLVSEQLTIQEHRRFINEDQHKVFPLKVARVVPSTFIREAIEMLPSKPD
jgi:S1-C subfamily serine protease